MTSESAEPTPIATVVKIVTSGWTRDVYVSCPFCTRRHVHGYPFGDDAVGPRVAHCKRRVGDVGPPRVYDVVMPPSPVQPRATR
jgi:hypothetical protein